MRYPYISIYRVCAMLLIILCHIAQCAGNHLAYLFNGAVYGFLLLSGILLGNKEYPDTMGFYSRRLVRILIPYYILLLFYAIVYPVCHEPIGGEIISNIFCAQWFVPGIKHAGHLWYITCIVLCYAAVPLLQFLLKDFKCGKGVYWCGIAGLGILCLCGSIIQPINLLFPFSFLLGYTYSRLYRSCHDDTMDSIEYSIVAIGLVLMLGRIGYDQMAASPLPGIVGDICEISFAFSALLILKKWFSIPPPAHAHRNTLPALIRGGVAPLDSISYECYLSHHIFILGTLSVMELTPHFLLNAILAFTLTLLTAALIHYLSGRIVSTTFKKNV